jgi:acyl carrier protein
MTRDEIFEKVQDVLEDALGVDEDEVTEDATLMGDLGAESIDFLDIVFRLEKTFDVKIAREDLFPGENLITDTDLIADGKLTDKGLSLLKENMPHMDVSEFEKDPDLNKLGDLFTVRAVVNYMEHRLANA